MKLQQTCTCGAKFIGMTDPDDQNDNEKDLLRRYDIFSGRHASCHKVILGIHSSQKEVSSPEEVVASLKEVLSTSIKED